MSAPDNVDMFGRLAQSASGRRILDMLEDQARERDGVARQAQWECEDGWIVIYTTSRVVGGKHDGSFIAQLLRPEKGGWVQDDRRVCDKRSEAKARAIGWFRTHSPRWDASHPVRTGS